MGGRHNACAPRPARPGFAALVAGTFACAGAFAAQAAELTVEAGGFDPSPQAGAVLVELYASRVGFLKSPRERSEAVVDGDVARATFTDLPPGDYAALVWQDSDPNGELDRGMFGGERFGFSNGQNERRPDWDAVRVTLGPEPQTVAVTLVE